MLISTIQPASANNLKTDHPLISQFEGAQYFSNYNFDYIAADIPVAMVDDVKSAKNKLTVEGKGSFIAYTFPISASSHEVIKSYKEKLVLPTFDVIFECEKNDKVNTCGNEITNFSRQNNLEFGSQYACTTQRSFYLSTSKVSRNDGKNSYVFICIFDKKVNQTIIEEKDFNSNKIIVSASYSPTSESLSALSKQTKKDVIGSKDHPLISRYPGSIISLNQKVDLGEVIFPIKNYKSYEKENISDDTFIKTHGSIDFILYRGQEGLSQYQVYENYLAAFKGSNMEILFTCYKSKECENGIGSSSDASDITSDAVRGDQCRGNDIAIIAAKKIITSEQNIYAYICIPDTENITISQTIIEEKPLDLGLINLSADAMSNAILTTGKVAIYGINFESNSDKLMESSTPTLEQVSILLSKNKKLKLYVVGHTDNEGKEIYNQNLSEKRAKAVVKRLVKTFGVSQEKLQARGVGELVPISTNQVNEGRKLNRRVELVQM